MFRSIVAIALIPGLLFAQFASVAHGHAVTEHFEQANTRPHIHLKIDSHDHAGHTHKHRHLPEPAEMTVAFVDSSPDHDADAIYIGDFNSVGVERSGWNEFVLDVQQFDSESFEFERPSSLVSTRTDLSTLNHAPQPHCALYVKHLALLI